MKRIIVFSMLAAALLALSGCYSSFEQPAKYTPAKMEANTSIKALKALYNGKPVEITDSLVISGVVVSSDREGNLYRTLFIQDESCGIELKIGKSGLYNDYPVGMRLYVNCFGLTLGTYGEMVNIGWKDESGEYETAYMDVQSIISSHIFRGEAEAAPEPVEITASNQFNSSNLGRLVTVRGLRADGGNVYIDGNNTDIATWAVSSASALGNGEAYSGNRYFYLGTRKLVVRTSGYARFADDIAPADDSTVDLTGILTVYRGTYQMILNSVSDVKVL